MFVVRSVEKPVVTSWLLDVQADCLRASNLHKVFIHALGVPNALSTSERYWSDNISKAREVLKKVAQRLVLILLKSNCSELKYTACLVAE